MAAQDPAQARVEDSGLSGSRRRASGFNHPAYVLPAGLSDRTFRVQFEPIGPVELKGLTETLSLHVARRAT